jgi:hypothetical protein
MTRSMNSVRLARPRTSRIDIPYMGTSVRLLLLWSGCPRPQTQTARRWGGTAMQGRPAPYR